MHNDGANTQTWAYVLISLHIKIKLQEMHMQ